MFVKKDKVSLRAIEPDDAPLLYKWENDRDSWAHSDNLLPYSFFQIEQFIIAGNDLYQNKQARFMIDFDADDEKVTVGMADIYDFHPHHRRAGLGIYIDPKFRKRGIAFEALQLLISHAFEMIGLHQLYCSIQPENHSSLRLFERLGFKLTGRQKDWFFENGSFHDQLLMQLINPKHLQHERVL